MLIFRNIKLLVVNKALIIIIKYISENYLIPNILKKHALKNSVIKFESDAIIKIIEDYTDEAGVRELERCISKIVRKVITEHIKTSRKIVSVRIHPNDISYYLKKEIFDFNDVKQIIHPGVVRVVACDNSGGTALDIECCSFKGNGNYTFTGSLGDVTKESIEVAISYIKSNASYFQIDETFFLENDIHIHFTEGGVAKDGPSAGSAITTAILSLIKNKIVSNEISMTGEISLKGDILKVGGVKEKSIAAKRFGINKLFVPYDNINDVEWLESDLKNNINFIPVKTYFDIYNQLFK